MFLVPGNGSPMTTNVVLAVVLLVGVGVVVIRFANGGFFFISQPIVAKLCIHIGNNIIHNRTVTDFQVTS